jgi:predicted membrane channel-forming protein YqfA (hemolysin III family)
MIEELKNIKGTRQNLRKFAITIAIVLAVIGAVLFWKDRAGYQYLWIAALVLVACGWAMPVILKPLYFVWMAFAALLGWIMTRVILGILFYIIFTPIGVIGRLLGKRFLDLRWKAAADSYWEYRQGDQPGNENHEKQF